MEGRGACIVQRDNTVLLDARHSGFADARARLSVFAELIKSPPVYHTYRISLLSLWNAASMGISAAKIVTELRELSRLEVPEALVGEISGVMSRYGRLVLRGVDGEPGRLVLCAAEESLMDELEHSPVLLSLSLERTGLLEMSCLSENRGLIKQELVRLGYPVLDHAGYHEGQSLQVKWKEESLADSWNHQMNRDFELRDYQREAVERFNHNSGSDGSGVVVLPCGAGKTVVGMAVLNALQCETLILTSNTTSVRQWIDELKSRTSLSEEDIGEYTGEKRVVRPVTVATYQILTHRRNKGAEFRHMNLFGERNWGLIIYDEVHLLPAPVFRATADIQATRRLGLTATLVREDGREGDVFSLIGPKRFELPWKALERDGWIAKVDCIEMTVPMDKALKQKYKFASAKDKFRLAATNPAKIQVVRELLHNHSGKAVLIIGQYIEQLEMLTHELGIPLITGATPQQERLALYSAFNSGELKVLAVSKVANFAVNLPDASVGIEISGAFGSRQEEAQRLGRILRPKSGENKASFYVLVSDESREQEFALRRRMFLTEQGYQYELRSSGREEIME
ncbi:DNA repair helicase XPB [Paenibacillus sp. sgz500958]|uniref:DNA repair helicase XPB n=1 Tax=Paenibacillus sp. sgz500958 TaxID=3242475 RepID=UPI0036D20F81